MSNASAATLDQMYLPQLSPLSQQSDNMSQQSELNVKDKTKLISNQLSGDSNRTQLISRMAKMGQQMIPNSNEPESPAELT